MNGLKVLYYECDLSYFLSILVKSSHILLNLLIVSWKVVSSDVRNEGLSRGINKFGIDLYQVLFVSFLRLGRTH